MFIISDRSMLGRPDVANLMRTAECVAADLGIEDLRINLSFFDTASLDRDGSIGITGLKEWAKDHSIRAWDVAIALKGDVTGDPAYSAESSIVHELRHVYQQAKMIRRGLNPIEAYRESGGRSLDGSYQTNPFEEDAQLYASQFFGRDYVGPGQATPGYEMTDDQRGAAQAEVLGRMLSGMGIGPALPVDTLGYSFSNKLTHALERGLEAYGHAIYPALGVPYAVEVEACLTEAFSVSKGDRVLLDGSKQVTVIAVHDSEAAVIEVATSWVGNVPIGRLTPKPLPRTVEPTVPEPYHYALHHGHNPATGKPYHFRHGHASWSNKRTQGDLDTLAMDEIQAAMSGVMWSPDTIEDVAEIVISTGREIDAPQDVAEPWSNRLELVNADPSPKVQSLYREALAIYDTLGLTLDTTIQFYELPELPLGTPSELGRTQHNDKGGPERVSVASASFDNGDPIPPGYQQWDTEGLTFDPRFTTAHEMRHVWQWQALSPEDFTRFQYEMIFLGYGSNPLELDASVWALDYLKGRPLPANTLEAVEAASLPIIYGPPASLWGNRRMDFAEADVFVLRDALNAYAVQVNGSDSTDRDIDRLITHIARLQSIIDHNPAGDDREFTSMAEVRKAIDPREDEPVRTHVGSIRRMPTASIDWPDSSTKAVVGEWVRRDGVCSNRVEREFRHRTYFLNNEHIYREPSVPNYPSVLVMKDASPAVFDVFIFALDMGAWNELEAVQWAATERDISQLPG